MKVENKIIFSSTGKHVCPTRMTITILVRSQSVDIILRKAIHISASVQLFPIFEILKDFKVAVNVSSSGKPVLRYMYYVNEPGLTLLMKKTP